ncbi:MAG: site-specific integrase [Nannocystis sp.]|nr:site-specific integrase [Nannocystis sp.]
MADDPDNAAIILLLLHCSLRVSEVCALRWSDIDFRRKVVTICHNYSDGEDSTPKGIVSAPVGLTPVLATALRALPRGHDHVLVRTYKGEVTHHTAHSIRVRLNAMQRAAGLPETGPHFLRHSGITIMADRGLDIWKLQAHARHARIATTQGYVHIAKEAAVIDAAAVWAQAKPVAKTRPKRPKGAGNSATLTN